MKFLWFILAVVALGMAGLFGWYGSLHPCDMLMKDSLRNVQKGSGEGDFFSSLEQIFSPVGMSPGECIQALAKLHLGAPEAREASTTETKPDRVAKKEHKHATKKALSKTEEVLEKIYQDLLNPPTKGDAPGNEPGYNTRMRDEMRRAIEGIGGTKTSVSEQNALERVMQDQLRNCWRMDPGARGAEDIVIEIKVLLNQDGSVHTAEIVDAVRMVQDGYFRRAAENAKRAVKQCSPFQLPPDKYDVWRKLTLRFDPRDAS